MEVIKKGSKGEAVKKLQKALGVASDGVFGANTEAAVKKFQFKAGLTPDGIVGAKTWAALENNPVDNKSVDDCVIYNPLSVHITPSKGRSIKYLAIHFTAGSSSIGGRAINVKRTFETSPASADFCVDDRDIVQFNPDIKKLLLLGGRRQKADNRWRKSEWYCFEQEYYQHRNMLVLQVWFLCSQRKP